MVVDHRHGVGIVRREFLQVGFSGLLGLGMGSMVGGSARASRGDGLDASFGRAKALVLVFLTGGPSQLDMFDPKPDAPADIRGEFGSIATKVPGLRLGEHLPGLAARAHHLAVVRSLTHSYRNHLNATHEMLTGQPQPGAFFDKIGSRDDWPHYASALRYTRTAEQSAATPTGVLLPTYLMEGPLIWPGQHAGFLGPKFDPWQIRQDPSKPDFRVEELSMPEGLSVERLQSRQALLETIRGDQARWLEETDGGAFGEQRRRAFEVLGSGGLAEAFRIDREPDEVRDRYGRHTYGQSLLLARRLIEAGVKVVQVNAGRAQTWDTHNDNFRRLKNDLLPPLDRGVSALLDDLEESGRLGETLVVVAGEFGRTPKVGRGIAGGAGANPTGRDHWPSVFSAVMAGGGVAGGQAVGSSDKNAAYPASLPSTPADFAATIYHALGVDPDTEMRDRLNRPIRLVTGRAIAPVFGA
jgi:hypothetical protein